MLLRVGVQETVNPLVASSNLASGDYVTEALRVKTLGAFLFSERLCFKEKDLLFVVGSNSNIYQLLDSLGVIFIRILIYFFLPLHLLSFAFGNEIFYGAVLISEKGKVVDATSIWKTREAQ